MGCRGNREKSTRPGWQVLTPFARPDICWQHIHASNPKCHIQGRAAARGSFCLPAGSTVLIWSIFQQWGTSTSCFPGGKELSHNICTWSDIRIISAQCMKACPYPNLIIFIFILIPYRFTMRVIKWSIFIFDPHIRMMFCHSLHVTCAITTDVTDVLLRSPTGRILLASEESPTHHTS